MRSLLVGLAATTLLLTVAACSDDADSTDPTTQGTDAPTTDPGSDDWPDGPATVTGIVEFVADAPDALRLAEPSDAYYQGMSLGSITALVRGTDGRLLTTDDLEAGDHIAVWTEGGCAESFPVQCTILAIEVLP
jgi:hypothetical protein